MTVLVPFTIYDEVPDHPGHRLERNVVVNLKEIPSGVKLGPDAKTGQTSVLNPSEPRANAFIDQCRRQLADVSIA